jgi:hypothetical protein
MARKTVDLAQPVSREAAPSVRVGMGLCLVLIRVPAEWLMVRKNQWKISRDPSNMALVSVENM